MHYKYCAECEAALVGVHQCCPNGCIQPPGEYIKIQNQNDTGPTPTRFADSYAALIERAEKAEAEVERLKEEIAASDEDRKRAHKELLETRLIARTALHGLAEKGDGVAARALMLLETSGRYMEEQP